MPMLPSARPMPWIKKTKPFENAKRSFDYGTTTWQAVRAMKRRLNPLCELCQARGIIKEASLVDHILSVSNGGEPYEMSNLQCLCRECHSKKTANEINDRRYEAQRNQKANTLTARKIGEGG